MTDELPRSVERRLKHQGTDILARLSMDRAAMNTIHKLLDGVEWSADTLDEIARAVLVTGREIRSPEEKA